MRLTVGLWLALAPACIAEFVPAKVSPRAASSSRWTDVLKRQATYLIQTVNPADMPHELEHAIRPLTATAVTLAVCSRLGPCAGDSKAESLAAEIVGNVTRAHLTGGGATANGKAWGHHWQSALWAWQAAFAGWLIQDKLSADVRARVERMTIDEADRFIDMPAPYSRHYDTKAEENAWNSHILVLASEALPKHAHAARWRARALEYMISSFATPADVRSTRKVDGRPLSEWVRGANVHSDYTLENHGFVHPDYMTTMSLNLMNAIMYRLLGKPVPEACTFNVQPIYENLKWMSMPDGGFLYPSGTDWNLHRIDATAGLHAQVARILGDPDAAALEQIALETLQRMQSRNASGRTFVPGEFTSYPGHEPNAGWVYAFAALTEQLWPLPAKTVTADQLWAKLAGARMLDDARMFVVRTPNAVSSFTWGLRVMGQTIPLRRDWILAPLNRSWVGLAGRFEPDSTPSRIGIGSRALESALARDPLSIGTVIAGEESGAMHVTATARRGTGNQVFSFAALPTGKSIYMERWRSNAPLLGGLISILQEKNWVYGGGERKIETDSQTWLSIDGALGFAVSQGGGIERIGDIATTLVSLNANPRQDTVVVTLPNADASVVKQFAESPYRLKTSQSDVSAVVVDGFVVVTNFSPHPLTAELEVDGGKVLVPVSGISTRVQSVRR